MNTLLIQKPGQVATLNRSPQGDHTHEHNVDDEGHLLPALLAMTLVTGVVDAVSCLGFGHIFTANMTGNVVLLGFALAGAPRLSIARALTALLAFLFGAVVAGRLGLRLSAATRRQYVVTTAALESVLLCAGALACVSPAIATNRAGVRLYLAIVLTSLAMGLRTVTVRRLGVADIATTVVTTTLATLAGDSSLAGGSNLRMSRRLASALCVFAGATIGTLLLRFGLALPLMFGGIVVIAAATLYARAPSAPSHAAKENV